MAREAYRSLYGDLKKLKDDSLLKDPANGTGDDDELFQLLFTVSEWVERWCNRFFYPRTQTLKFDGDGSKRLLVPDLLTVTTLKEDTTDDQTFDVFDDNGVGISGGINAHISQKRGTQRQSRRGLERTVARDGPH